MKLKEFRKKYLTRIRYSGDRLLFDRYSDAEIIAHSVVGLQTDSYYVYYESHIAVCIIKSERSYMAFKNGERYNLHKAIKFIENCKIEYEINDETFIALKQKLILEVL
jgi:hypothetical protein